MYNYYKEHKKNNKKKIVHPMDYKISQFYKIKSFFNSCIFRIKLYFAGKKAKMLKFKKRLQEEKHQEFKNDKKNYSFDAEISEPRYIKYYSHILDSRHEILDIIKIKDRWAFTLTLRKYET